MNRMRVFFSRLRKWFGILVLYIPTFFYFFPELNRINPDILSPSFIINYIIPFVSGLIIPSALLETFSSESKTSIATLCLAVLAFVGALVLGIIFISWYVPVAFILGCVASTMIVDLAQEYIEQDKLYIVKAVFWIIGVLCILQGAADIYLVFNIPEETRKNITDISTFIKSCWAMGISFIMVGYLLSAKGFAIGQFEKTRDAFFDGLKVVSTTSDSYGNRTVTVENTSDISSEDLHTKAGKL